MFWMWYIYLSLDINNTISIIPIDLCNIIISYLPWGMYIMYYVIPIALHLMISKELFCSDDSFRYKGGAIESLSSDHDGAQWLCPHQSIPLRQLNMYIYHVPDYSIIPSSTEWLNLVRTYKQALWK
jgi:hypothetical protein